MDQWKMIQKYFQLNIKLSNRNTVSQNKWSQIDSNQPTWLQTKIFQKNYWQIILKYK